MTNDLQATPSCCGTSATNPAADVKGRENLMRVASSASSGEMTNCPVMGSAVYTATAEVTGLYREDEGHRYHFCCEGCGPASDSNPAKYAADVA